MFSRSAHRGVYVAAAALAWLSACHTSNPAYRAVVGGMPAADATTAPTRDGGAPAAVLSPDGRVPFSDAAGGSAVDSPPSPDRGVGSEASPSFDAPFSRDTAKLVAPDAPIPGDVAAPPVDVLPTPDLPVTPVNQSALFVVGQLPLKAADGQLRDRLASLGLVVSSRLDLDATFDLASASALVVISGSVTSTRIAGRLRDVRVPVVCFETALFDEMAMTGPVLDVDHGSAPSENRVSIVQPTHPLAAGLMGAVTVLEQPANISWGSPPTGATRVATLPGQTERATVFGYSTGAQMYKMPAPAARVGLFVTSGGATLYTSAGLALFEAAARWALGR